MPVLSCYQNLMLSCLLAGYSERHVHTDLDLSSDVLLAFSNAGSTASDATFNVRDFKAMVALCEVMRSHVAISFDSAGAPMVVSPQPTGEDGLVRGA